MQIIKSEITFGKSTGNFHVYMSIYWGRILNSQVVDK